MIICLTRARVAELAYLPTGRQARTTKIMYHVYALQSVHKNYIYVGMTNNLERRVNQHQKCRERTTAYYAPFKLILSEQYNTRPEARNREKYLKSGVGKEFLKKLT